MAAGTFAAIGELHVILRKTIRGVARTARHLWRMCLSMFIASGSLFFGQPQVFPQWFHDTAAPVWLGLFPIFAMLIWLVIVRLPRQRRAAAPAKA